MVTNYRVECSTGEPSIKATRCLAFRNTHISSGCYALFISCSFAGNHTNPFGLSPSVLSVSLCLDGGVFPGVTAAHSQVHQLHIWLFFLFYFFFSKRKTQEQPINTRQPLNIMLGNNIMSVILTDFSWSL